MHLSLPKPRIVPSLPLGRVTWSEGRGRYRTRMSLDGWQTEHSTLCFLAKTARGLTQKSREGLGAELGAGPCIQQLPGSVYLSC